ncbi:MAG TPA: sigma-70 family RNA polymerase sigma factor [Opitutus sp.]|nr:sigma-70 family RNA polymerase sigma factor [Opitutus sp.]
MPPSDAELLRRYALDRSEPAFTELVHRHLDLVYAVAKRTLRSDALAADVTQSVFLDLAHRASSFRHDATVVAWLHVVTRRTAIDLIRRESRRHTREQSAGGAVIMDSSSEPWAQLAPLLDEALSHLGETDRAAVLLRFFENKSLRDVGAVLGVSDDAAQKRLTRALDRLRTFFVRRGIAVSAAVLASELPLHAIETAPATLGATISAAAAAKTTAGLSLAHTTKTFAMTATQKVLATTTLVAVLGSLFEAHLIHVRNLELADLRQRTAQLERDLSALRAAHAKEAHQSAADRDELATLRARLAAFNAGDPAIEDALDSWLQRVVTLKKKLAASPELQIPELKFLTAKDWLDATKETTLDTEMDLRAALSQLRTDAKMHFEPRLYQALKHYLEANNNQPPSEPTQLAPFLEASVDPAILQHYRIYSPKDPGNDGIQFTARDGSVMTWAIRESQSVDPYFDTQFQISAEGYGYSARSQFDSEVDTAVTAFRKANNNLAPTAPAQLAPYLHSQIDPAFISRKLDSMNHR